MHVLLPYVAYTRMFHPRCVFLGIFFVILGLGFDGYNRWYLMYVSLYKCVQQNTPFYMFNKDNMEHASQVKRGHVECGGSLFGKDDVTFRSFPKILD